MIFNACIDFTPNGELKLNVLHNQDCILNAYCNNGLIFLTRVMILRQMADLT